MNKSILQVKGITLDNKWKYVLGDNKTKDYIYVESKNNATIFESVEIYVAEENIKEIAKENGYDISKIEFKRIKYK